MDKPAEIPSPNHHAYRVFRLRRQIVVLGSMPLFGALIGGIYADPQSLFAEPLWIAALTLAWLSATVALSVRFPAGWTDLVAMSVVVTGLAALAPAISWVLGAILANGNPVLFLFAVLGLGFGTIFAVLGLVLAQIGLLAGRPLGERRFTQSALVDVPVERLRAQCFLKPGCSYRNRETGPADPDGIFEVISHFEMPNPATLEPERNEILFHAQILETGDDTQSTLYFIGGLGEGTTTSVEKLTIREENGRTRYTHEEVHDHFDLFAGLGWWLTDAGGDALTETLDLVMDRPVRALRRMPQDTPLSWLAGWMLSRGLGADA